MKTTSEKQAIAQILKMHVSIDKLNNQMEYERGPNWRNITKRNEALNHKKQELFDKIETYKQFITEEGFDNSELPIQLCYDYTEFISE